jgi:hypothetical protein
MPHAAQWNAQLSPYLVAVNEQLLVAPSAVLTSVVRALHVIRGVLQEVCLRALCVCWPLCHVFSRALTRVERASGGGVADPSLFCCRSCCCLCCCCCCCCCCCYRPRTPPPATHTHNHHRCRTARCMWSRATAACGRSSRRRLRRASTPMCGFTRAPGRQACSQTTPLPTACSRSPTSPTGGARCVAARCARCVRAGRHV